MSLDSNKPLNINPKKNLVLFITLGLLIAFFSLFVYEQASIDRHLSSEEHQIRQKLSNYRTKLEHIVNYNLILMEGLTAYIAITPNITQQEFANYSSLLLAQDNNIRNIGGAKDLVISHMYPLAGNEAALGLNYRENPQQKRVVEMAMALNHAVIAGPLNLVQGGVGLIARLPVTTENGPWGVVSVVLDYDSMLEHSGLLNETMVNIAIRGKDGLGKDGDTFYGDPTIFSRSQLIQNVSIPFGQWQLVGEATNQMPAYKTNPKVWFFALACLGFWCFIGFQRYKSNVLYQKSIELTAQSEQKFRSFFSAHTAPMLIISDDGEIIDANKAASLLYGYSTEELKALDVAHINALAAQHIALSLDGDSTKDLATFASSHTLKSGETIQVEVRSAPINSNGKQLIFAILTDVTEKHQLEQKLKLDAQVFEYSQEGIIITDSDKKIISINKGFTDITGYVPADVLGQVPSMFSSSIHSELFYQKMFDEIALKGFWKGEIKNRNKDGSINSELLSISKVDNERGQAVNYVIVFSDISKLKKTEEHLEKLAHYDTLTNLPNRLLLKTRLNHAIRNAQRLKTKLAIMFLDLDRFKIINDSLGHKAGDELLQLVSNRLSRRIRQSDTLARIGGDEFVILLENIKQSTQLDSLAKELISELNKPFRIADDQEVYIGTSIGISIYPDDSGLANELISFADAAMYRAKQSGRNVYSLYTSNITDLANEKLKLSTEIKHAIECNELELYYQAQVDLISNKTVAAEGLLRWNHPQRGLVTPAEFIHVAEETGLIHQLTLWIIEQACKQLSDWTKKQVPLALSVNISAMDFNASNFQTEVETLLKKYSFAPGLLEFEVLENVMMENIGDAISKLEHFRDMGITIAIDNFGTGYSSLAYLGNLPADKLKIDRGFINEIQPDGAKSEIALSAISLAKNFNLALVAEGVEQEYQATFLRDKGCQFVQGNLFGAPLTLKEFEQQNLAHIEVL